jgi:hypothetical protein
MYTPIAQNGGRICAILWAVLLAGCAATGPREPGAPDTATQEQRLQALEAGLQRLAQRVDELQGASSVGRAAPVTAEPPVEYRPIRPEVVLTERPVTPPVVPETAPQPPSEREPRPPQPATPLPGPGHWVINLASYTSRNFASRKLAEFIGAGVDAEQVAAEVNGATIYRLQVSGFDTYATASAEAGEIREKLGLDETWVARR